MNAENARRLAERQERDRQKIRPDQVERYRELHYPRSKAKRDAFIERGGIEVPGDGYIATLPHERFHEWFGTECDDTCPHPRGFRRPTSKARLRERRWHWALQAFSCLAALFWVGCLVQNVCNAVGGERTALYIAGAVASVLCIWLEVGRIRRRAREARKGSRCR